MLFAKKGVGLNTVILLRILLFAIFSEVVQYSLPYRTFNINDLASNLMGVLLGLLLAKCIKRIPF
jgi:glycopeptide antibiotics resistance protein